jgi:hypothetical protein
MGSLPRNQASASSGWRQGSTGVAPRPVGSAGQPRPTSPAAAQADDRLPALPGAATGRPARPGRAGGFNLIGAGPANLRPGQAGWVTLSYADGCPIERAHRNAGDASHVHRWLHRDAAQPLRRDSAADAVPLLHRVPGRVLRSRQIPVPGQVTTATDQHAWPGRGDRHEELLAAHRSHSLANRPDATGRAMPAA